MEVDRRGRSGWGRRWNDAEANLRLRRRPARPAGLAPPPRHRRARRAPELTRPGALPAGLGSGSGGRTSSCTSSARWPSGRGASRVRSTRGIPRASLGSAACSARPSSTSCRNCGTSSAVTWRWWARAGSPQVGPCLSRALGRGPLGQAGDHRSGGDPLSPRGTDPGRGPRSGGVVPRPDPAAQARPLRAVREVPEPPGRPLHPGADGARPRRDRARRRGSTLTQRIRSRGRGPAPAPSSSEVSRGDPRACRRPSPAPRPRGSGRSARPRTLARCARRRGSPPAGARSGRGSRSCGAAACR